MRRTLGIGAVAAALVCAGARLAAQDDADRAVERYRRMLTDDPWSNPALPEADRGKAL
jgi:sulfur-oxidizing protein SoxA